MNYIKQILFEMCHQKMMMWVSIGATALSIFMVMAFYMNNQLKTVATAPMLDRARIATGRNYHISFCSGGSRSGPLGYELATRLYSDLEGVEMMSIVNQWPESKMVGPNILDAEQMSVKYTDEIFWKIYQFKFLEGKPYSRSQIESGAKVAVISESVARRVLNNRSAIGKEIVLDGQRYTVNGIVKDVHPLLSDVYSDIWLPLTPEMQQPTEERFAGNNLEVRMLMKSETDVSLLQTQVESRYASLNSEMKNDSIQIRYHGQPYSDEIASTYIVSSNIDPTPPNVVRISLFIYALLLILPAINLSSMTRSRLRRRESEIGIRRAFGASRTNIVLRILGENFIVTLAGGIIGLLSSIMFMLFLSTYFKEQAIDFETVMVDPTGTAPLLSMLFSWSGFAVAIGFCFLLNLLSAFSPAWKASRMTPADAISQSK